VHNKNFPRLVGQGTDYK